MKASYFFCEADASSAVDASIHVGDDQRTNIFVLYCAFVFFISARSVSIEVGVVLEIALSTLITDGTIERMVGEQEFHDCTSSEASNLRICPNFHCGRHL